MGREGVQRSGNAAANPAADVQASDTQGIIAQQVRKETTGPKSGKRATPGGGRHYIW